MNSTIADYKGQDSSRARKREHHVESWRRGRATRTAASEADEANQQTASNRGDYCLRVSGDCCCDCAARHLYPWSGQQHWRRWVGLVCAASQVNKKTQRPPLVVRGRAIPSIRKGNVDVTEESLGKLSFSSTYHVDCARNVLMTCLSCLQGMAGTAALEAQLVSPYYEVGDYLPEGCKIVWYTGHR